MTTIPAEDFEVRIQEGMWQLIPASEDTLSSLPVFQVARGGGIMEYTPAFAESQRLPGTVLSIEYVQAVVIGYQEKSQRWLLGLHIAKQSTDKPRWLELVRWPSGDNMLYGAAAQQAGRGLADHLGCPLKIFGAKKLTTPLDPAAVGGVTGPLVPHKREDIGPQQVRLRAQSLRLPLENEHMWLGRSRSGLTLRVSKEALTGKDGRVAPSFNQCVIDAEHGSIRMIPPTGLLGNFLGGQKARSLQAKVVRNVEVRHTLRRISETQRDAGGMVTEVSRLVHVWDIYLTLPDESLLLAQTRHVTSSELARKRATATDLYAVDSESGIAYLRQHEADQKAYDAAADWAEAAAIVIAAELAVRLAKTDIEEEAAG
ncbi:MAG: hypothetical protein GYB65_08590 [Chloroflexi bacterium]|nr:hypothetical protein [Chloroflexota bacterium]